MLPEGKDGRRAGRSEWAGERGVAMPWFPDFVSAVELARGQTRAASLADPVGQYFTALNKGDPTHWRMCGRVRWCFTIPALMRFAVTGSCGGSSAATCPGWPACTPARRPWPRHVSAAGPWLNFWPTLDHNGRVLAWPVAVVAESTDDLSEAVVSSFAPDGYFCGPFGPHYAHRGTDELRSFFTRCFSAGGGIGLRHCAVTDDGVRCALEYNCVRWGSQALPPQAGLGVYERGPDGLLAAARVYDDVESPVGHR